MKFVYNATVICLNIIIFFMQNDIRQMNHLIENRK